MKLETGTLSINRRDPAQGGILRSWLNACVPHTFADRLLPVTLAVARRCASLQAPNPQPEPDALIAATALVHGMTVIKRNVADFRSSGVPVVNPWNA